MLMGIESFGRADRKMKPTSFNTFQQACIISSLGMAIELPSLICPTRQSSIWLVLQWQSSPSKGTLDVPSGKIGNCYAKAATVYLQPISSVQNIRQLFSPNVDSFSIWGVERSLLFQTHICSKACFHTTPQQLWVVGGGLIQDSTRIEDLTVKRQLTADDTEREGWRES